MHKQRMLRLIIILILIFTVSCQPNNIADNVAPDDDNTIPDIAWLDNETDIIRCTEIVQPWEWEEAPKPTTEIYLATYRDMKIFDEILDTQAHIPVQTKPIRVFGEKQRSSHELSAYACAITSHGINTIYSLWRQSSSSVGKISTIASSESNEYIQAISSLAYLTSEEHPMYICYGKDVSFVAIDDTAYIMPSFYREYNGSLLEVMYDKDEIEIIKVDLSR